MKKLCIIHTTPSTVISLKPLAQAILQDVQVYNILDDSILPEINDNDGKITPSVERRFEHMVQIAVETRPDAILVACSTIGELAETAASRIDIPLKRIDEPMCRKAADFGDSEAKIGVAAALKSTLDPTCNLIRRIAAEKGKHIGIKSMLIDGAAQLLNEGKGEEYDALVSSKLIGLASECDVVVLAQASMARALNAIKSGRDKYLTSPESGLESLRCIL